MFALPGAYLGLLVACLFFFRPGRGWGGPEAFPRFCLAVCAVVHWAAIPAIIGACVGAFLELFADDDDAEDGAGPSA